MKKYITFLMLTCFTYPAFADMYKALEDVYRTNPEILAGREKVSQTQADVDLSKTGWQPAIGANAGISRAKTKVNGLHSEDTYTQKEYGITLTQNIFKGFSTTAQIDAAKSILKAEEANLYATEQNVFLSAINAYIDVLNAKEVLKLNKNNEKVLNEYYDLYVEKEKVGVLTKTDVAQAKARLEGAKYRVIDAKAKYDNALETFRRIYGKVEDNYQPIDLKNYENLFPKSIDDAEKQALKNHPAILAANAMYQAADENVTVARQTLMPSVDIKASALKYDDVPVANEMTDSRIGIYLTVPLYDQGATFAKTKKAKAEKSQVQVMITQTERVVLEKLHQAWNLHQAQTSAIRSAESRVSASKLALSGVRDEQQRGRRTVLDVLNAERELLDSKVMLTQAKHAKISAFFAVLSGIGKLTPEHLGLGK